VSSTTATPNGYIDAIGRAVIHMTQASGEGVILLARALRHLPSAWGKRAQIVSQMLICGVYSMPVALLVAAFSGMVLALQVGTTLQQYRQAATVGALVAVSMCREMGPVWVGVILAARVGSAMAAELGTMRVSEEIDALEVMSIDPARFLVMPRVLALTLIAPVLTAFADAIGILGGAVVSRYQVGVRYQVYFDWAQSALTQKDILSGLLIKAPVFGLAIATAGCALGLRVKPAEGAEGVGKATRHSVVVALVLLIVFNYFLTSFIRYI
jgi:phospholipid/cholesterol/gamma-HCH transport system permease protein